MLETSKDILFIVIAFCVLWLTIFSCWLLYYCIKILRNASAVIDSIQDRLKGIEEAVHMVKEKIENASSSMRIVVESVGLMVKYFINRRARNDSISEDDENGMDDEPAPSRPTAAQTRSRKKSV